MCFAKENIATYANEINVVKYIHEIRNPENYPKDGGYSGAILLERRENLNQIGEENKQYSKIYCDSLSDMPKAYDSIKHYKPTMRNYY